mgnify:CR=1 FL=1
MKTFCIVATNGLSLVNFRGAFIKELVAQKYRVICVSIESEYEMGNPIRNLGAEYKQVSGDRTGIGILSGIKMIMKYFIFLRKVKPDYCFLYMSKAIAFGGIAAILAKISHINILINGLENAYYRSGLKDALVRFVMSFFYRITASRADNVFFQNHDDMNFFISHNMLRRNNGSVVGGSGVDMEFFAPQPLPKEPVVLMTARLLWSKGIREFLEAIKLVKQKYPELEVLLVGGLDHNDEALKKEELDKCIREYDIEYCGYAQDVRPYLKRCSIYVLPSYHEGLPRSVLEAMALGRPIVTTDVPGCRETVDEGINGFLVPAKNSIALAEKLEILIQTPALRCKMAEKSYEICKKNFEVHLVNRVLLSKMSVC